MSFLTDALKSGANMVAGTVADKLGVDPAQAQSLVNQFAGDPAAEASQDVAPVDEEQAPAEAETEAEAQDAEPATDAAPDDQTAESAEAAPGGLIGQAAAMFGGASGIAASATQLLDRDGDGNPLNDVANLASSFFGRK